MAGHSGDVLPKWVTRRNGGGKRYKVRNSYMWSYEIELPDLSNTYRVPCDDYEPCGPPIEDVTHKLEVKSGVVVCGEDRIANLCCNGKYTVQFNPFKVEKVS